MSENHRSDILFAFGVMVALAIAWYIRDVLLLIYVSALFAVVLGPGVQWVQKLHIGKWHPNRGVAMILLLGAFLALITIFFVFALPPIFRDIQQFSTDLPSKIQRLQDRMQQLPFARHIDPSILKAHAAGAVGGV